jgi:hypothetical protein
MQNQNSTFTGSDVMVYFDPSSTFDPKLASVILSTKQSGWGSSTISNGLVFWYSNCDTLDFQGDSDTEFSGIFYAPCAHVSLHGNPGSSTIDGQIFVGTLELKGTSNVSLTYKKWVDTTRPKVFLVE